MEEDYVHTLYRENIAMFSNHPIAFLIGICFSLVGIGIPIMLLWWIQCKTTTLEVTTERTVLRRGILSKSLVEVWHRDVRSVQLEQSLIQRIFDVGYVGISSAGHGGVEIAVDGIPRPHEVKTIIDEHKRVSSS